MNSRNKFQRSLFALLAAVSIFAADKTSQAQIAVTVYASQGPNIWIPDSVEPYLANGKNTLIFGAPEGDPLLSPSAFTVATAFDAGHIITTTSTPSWLGNFSPAPPFQNEQGGQLFFWVDIRSVSAIPSIQLDQLHLRIDSSDGILTATSDFVSPFYNGITTIGYNWGPDNIRGTMDDFVIAPTIGNTAVHELLVAVWDGYDWDSDYTGTRDSIIGQQVTLTVDYNTLAQQTFTVDVVPEPSTYALLSLGITVLGFLLPKKYIPTTT
jgi:hypothetical protein